MASTYIPLGPLKDWNNPPNPAGSPLYDFTTPQTAGVQVITTSLMPIDLTYVDAHTPVLHQRFPINKSGASQRPYSKPSCKFKVGIFAADGRSDYLAWGDVEQELNALYNALDTTQEAILRVVTALGIRLPFPTVFVAATASFQGFQVNVAEGEFSRHMEVVVEWQLESPFA